MCCLWDVLRTQYEVLSHDEENGELCLIRQLSYTLAQFEFSFYCVICLHYTLLQIFYNDVLEHHEC